jgi:hypothetical protein
MTTKQWKIFWQAPMTHGVRTVWWRLLTHKLPHQEALRHIRSKEENPGWCKICNKTTEDAYHMIYSCSLKPSFWTAAIYLLDIKISSADIWPALNFQINLDTPSIVHLGDALYALWLQHWDCIIEGRIWNNTITMRRLRKILWHKDENHHTESMIAQHEEYLNLRDNEEE